MISTPVESWPQAEQRRLQSSETAAVEFHFMPPESTSSPPRLRWWLAFLLIAPLPFAFPLGQWLRGAPQSQFPGDVAAMLAFYPIRLALWAAIFGGWWLLTRASRAEMFLRWPGWKIMALGVLLSVGIRVAILSLMAALGFIAHFALIRAGMTPQTFEAMIRQNSRAESIFVPLISHGSPLYKALMLSFVAFIYAGLREELWRVLTMASLLHLAPLKWSRAKRNWMVLGVSSVLFGLGHGYQGWIGVIETGLIGLPLGYITLRRDSVWPAVLAHGCFDATSFWMVMLMAKR